MSSTTTPVASQAPEPTEKAMPASPSADAPERSSFPSSGTLSPTPNALLVSDISQLATPQTIRDFFSFCGEITLLEVLPSHQSRENDTTTSSTQTALLVFKDVTEANTARMLTNAVILGRPVRVESYFPGTGGPGTQEAERFVSNPHAPPSSSRAATLLVDTLTHLLASGYALTDELLQRGAVLDSRYNVTERVGGVVGQVKAEMEKLETKYGVVQRVGDVVGDRIIGRVAGEGGVVERAKGAVVGAVRGSRVGEQVWKTVEEVGGEVGKIQRRAKELAREKKETEAPPQQEGDIGRGEGSAEEMMGSGVRGAE